MTYRRMAAFPLLWVALFSLTALLVPAAQSLAIFRAENESSKVLGMVGCFVAAYAFERGDYLRRAWWLHAACYLLLLVRDGLRPILGDHAMVAGLSTDAIFSGIVLVANACAVAGTFLLARAWSVAGLELPGSRGARFALMGGAAVVALIISGPAIYADGGAVLRGNAEALTGVASDVGDVFSLALIAPVLLTAIAMRGGVLKWPWGLLTASMLFWLLYDLATTLNDVTPMHADWSRLVREAFRGLGCVYGFAAGLAQRRAITEPVVVAEGA